MYRSLHGNLVCCDFLNQRPFRDRKEAYQKRQLKRRIYVWTSLSKEYVYHTLNRRQDWFWAPQVINVKCAYMIQSHLPRTSSSVITY